LLPIARADDDLFGQFIRTLYAALGAGGVPLFLAAADGVPGLASFRAVMQIARDYLKRSLLPSGGPVDSIVISYGEILIQALEAVTEWSCASQEAREAVGADQAYFEFLRLAIGVCQPQTVQEVVALADRILADLSKDARIVGDVLDFLPDLPPEVAGKYAGLVVDLYHNSDDANPATATGSALIFKIWNLSKRLFSASPDEFAEALAARLQGVPEGFALFQRYLELLQSGEHVKHRVLSEFLAQIYEAVSGGE
jgi:hypothetical protein